LTIAARKMLSGDRVSLTVRAVDPFNTSRESATTIDPRFYQVSDRRRVVRGLFLGINWMFGKPLEDHRPAPADVGDSGPP
jgi:hypothetical protein